MDLPGRTDYAKAQNLPPLSSGSDLLAAGLSGLFVQILRFCQEAGMVSLGHVALNGTKVQANASKHKAMSHERML
jgi:hypothetical protein